MRDSLSAILDSLSQPRRDCLVQQTVEPVSLDAQTRAIARRLDSPHEQEIFSAQVTPRANGAEFRRATVGRLLKEDIYWNHDLYLCIFRSCCISFMAR